MKVFMIAGEASGDVLGGAILSEAGPVITNLQGIGGAHMQDHGLTSLFPMSDLSLMGLSEIVPKIPALLRRINQSVEAVASMKPDIVVTIDAPDFSFRVAKRLQHLRPHTRFFHVVAPTVWAWREKRAQKVAGLYDRLYCLLPFEPPYFEKYGLETCFIGHPILQKIKRNSYSERNKDVFLVLFGSRRGEVERLSPVFCDFMRNLKKKNPNIAFKSPVYPHLSPFIEGFCQNLSIEWLDPVNRYDAFRSAGFALAASGTAGLELALSGCPHMIGYKVNPLTWAIASRMVKTDHVHLANIISHERLIPELLQNECTSHNLMKVYENHRVTGDELAEKLIQKLDRPDGFSWDGEFLR